MKGTTESLVLYNWMPVTGGLLLNTPISFPANTFPFDTVPSKPCLEAEATQRTPGLAQLTPPQPHSPQATAERLKGFAYGSHCSFFYPGHAQQAKESWRRWGEGRGVGEG